MNNYRAASVKNLMTLNGVTKEEAILIRSVWKCEDIETLKTLYGEDKFNQLIEYFHNMPELEHLKALVIDDIMQTFGIEHLGWHRRNKCHVDYCNAGDTYAGTVIFMGDNLTVGCWGDLVENGLIQE